jgi:hypothetical protein
MYELDLLFFGYFYSNKNEHFVGSNFFVFLQILKS